MIKQDYAKPDRKQLIGSTDKSNNRLFRLYQTLCVTPAVDIEDFDPNKHPVDGRVTRKELER